MKPHHLKKPHNDKSDATQAAFPEHIMADDLRKRLRSGPMSSTWNEAADRGVI
jgi:hypothetical protein